MSKEDARRELFVPVILGVIYIISRILYGSVGVKFDADTITGLWHFIDIDLMQHDLWRSIFYLHTQPPLMNLLTGLGLQLFPRTYTSVFNACFLLGGFLLILAIYFLGNRLGFPKVLSAVLAAWFTLSPATVVFENYYFYTYPTTVLLMLSTLFLARFLEQKRAIDALLFSFLLAFNALTWSLFHLVWMLGCLLIALFLLSGERRKVLWFLPAFLLVFGWYAKNGVLYGSFTASTWAGLNVFKTVTVRVPVELRERWVKEGLVSELALVPPFRSPDVYLEYFPDTPLNGVPLLDDINMSNGYRNQHHLSYVYAGERYLKDSVHILLLAPGYYLSILPYNVYIYLHSASDYEHTINIRAPIDGWDTLWNCLFYGQWGKDESLAERSSTFSPDHFGWWLAISFVLVLIAAPVYLWQQRDRLYSLEFGMILFMFWNILFVSAAGILLDFGENNRTRFSLDPFILLLVIFFLRRILLSKRQADENIQIL